MTLRRTAILALACSLSGAALAQAQLPLAPSTLGAPPVAYGPANYGPPPGAPAFPNPAMLPPNFQPPYGVMPAAYHGPGEGPSPMQQAPPMMGQPMMGQPMMGPPAANGGPMPEGAPFGEYQGAGPGEGMCENPCGENDVGFRHMLFPENGVPRWYNISAEFLLLKRETGGGTAQYASDGIGGPIVLSADQFEFSEEPGFKLSWQTVLGPADSMELTYLGTFFWQDTAQATSNTNNLYTAFSQFGNLPFGGFSDADAASLLRTTYESDINSLELNYRYRWVSPNNRINNSLIMGVRWMRLAEQFRFQGQTATGVFDQDTITENNNVGLQLGFDTYVQVFRRLTLGGEAKAGLYGNDSLQRTQITATTLMPNYEESLHRTVAAFVAEANFQAVCRLTTHCSIKAGYELLFLDRVALASDNFNPAPVFLGTRTPLLNTAGEVFYHGFSGGFEWTW